MNAWFRTVKGSVKRTICLWCLAVVSVACGAREIRADEAPIAVCDREHWSDLHQGETPPELLTRVELKEPAEARYFRLLVTESSNPTDEVAVRKVVIE
jgi:hypothetical protein